MSRASSTSRAHRTKPVLTVPLRRGWNCIQRRSFGLLWAHDMNADIVAVVDDDNIPLGGLGRESAGRDATARWTATRRRCLPSIPSASPTMRTCGIAATRCNFWRTATFRVRIAQAGLRRRAGGLLERRSRRRRHLPHAARARVRHSIRRPASPCAANQMGPFNSQNTFLSGECLKDYFLFLHIGRMDDIWASFYLQAKADRVVWNKASVYPAAATSTTWCATCSRSILGYENNLNLVQDLARDAASIIRELPARKIGNWAFELIPETLPRPCVRFLVTGGAGFVGRHMIRRLLDAGDDVHAVDSLARRSPEPSILRCGWPLFDPRDYPGLPFLSRRLPRRGLKMQRH